MRDESKDVEDEVADRGKFNENNYVFTSFFGTNETEIAMNIFD